MTRVATSLQANDLATSLAQQSIRTIQVFTAIYMFYRQMICHLKFKSPTLPHQLTVITSKHSRTKSSNSVEITLDNDEFESKKDQQNQKGVVC